MYPFQFDKSIDSEYMSSMYEGDYQYIEQVFSVTLTHFGDDISIADNKYAAADVDGVRKAIHKIKSTFGFIGMMELQENCRIMEDKCASVNNIDEIKDGMEVLIQEINNHRQILQNEYIRLKNFNSQSQ